MPEMSEENNYDIYVDLGEDAYVPGEDTDVYPDPPPPVKPEPAWRPEPKPIVYPINGDDEAMFWYKFVRPHLNPSNFNDEVSLMYDRYWAAMGVEQTIYFDSYFKDEKFPDNTIA
jgi:hypothetical protein